MIFANYPGHLAAIAVLIITAGLLLFAFGSGELKKEKIDLREASVEKEGPKSAKKSQRDLGDLMMKVNKYLFLVCACGLRMKIPPDYKHDHIQCPKCGRNNEVPLEKLAAISTVIDDQTKKS